MTQAAEKSGAGKGGAIALVLLTLVAAGGGALHGLQTYRIIEAAGPASGAAAPSSQAQGDGAQAQGGANAQGSAAQPGAKAKLPSRLVTRELPPLITNIAMPPDLWVRLEATIVFDQAEVENPEVLIAEMSGDLLGFLRSLTLRELQGADGLLFLRQDMKERVALRTQNKVRDVTIQTLVVQ